MNSISFEHALATLRLNEIILFSRRNVKVYHNTMHLCIQRWLGYDPTMYNSDEPIPEAVARYEAFVQFWSFLLCIAGVVLVCEAKTCSDTAPELFGATARFAWVGFALAIACIATSLSTAIFVVLMRSGALTTSNAAPTGTLNVCRVVQTDIPSPEDEELLAPDQDGEAQTCPICMEIFGPDKEVRLTPCKHLFHGPCLAGWLNVSRCCPMCRHDFTQAPPPASTTAASTRPSAAARTSASASSQIEPQSQGGQADPLVPFSSAHFNAEQTSDNSRSGAADSGEESGSSAPNNNPAQSPPGGATPLSATSPRSERKEADNSPTRRRSPRSRDSGGGGTGSSRSPKNRRSPPPRNQRPNNNNEATTSGSGSATPTSTLANIRRLPSPTSENSSNFGSSSSYSSSSTSTSSSSDSSVVGAPQAVESSSSSAAEDNQADVPSPEEQALSGAGTHIGGL
jgi:hypothetical protein